MVILVWDVLRWADREDERLDTDGSFTEVPWREARATFNAAMELLGGKPPTEDELEEVRAMHKKFINELEIRSSADSPGRKA